jgi:flavin reductase (DIM6/NTAB) family NADH-FMN oxidoreductase RutF
MPPNPYSASTPQENCDGFHFEINPSVLYVGTPVALITSMNRDGSVNISPMSSAWALFDRVVLGLTSTSRGAKISSATGSS